MNRWPKDGEPANFEDLVGPLREALGFCYGMDRHRVGEDVPYWGLNVGDLHINLPVDEQLSARNLVWQADEHGRDAADVILGIAVQLGIEQGRRLARKEGQKAQTLLDSIEEIIGRES